MRNSAPSSSHIICISNQSTFLNPLIIDWLPSASNPRKTYPCKPSLATYAYETLPRTPRHRARLPFHRSISRPTHRLHLSGTQNFSLTGAIGQPDAATLTGGSFTLEGGFFPGIIVPSNTGAPTLYIQPAAGNLTISWLPATPGFLLEETTNLTTPNWSQSTPGNPTTPIPSTGDAKYYRLRKP